MKLYSRKGYYQKLFQDRYTSILNLGMDLGMNVKGWDELENQIKKTNDNIERVFHKFSRGIHCYVIMYKNGQQEYYFVK